VTSWWVKEKGLWIEDAEYPSGTSTGSARSWSRCSPTGPRLKTPNGVSELKDVDPAVGRRLQDRHGHDGQRRVSRHPRRVAFGFGESDFVDAQGPSGLGVFPDHRPDVGDGEEPQGLDGADVDPVP
jgi:hypothetical protein